MFGRLTRVALTALATLFAIMTAGFASDTVRVGVLKFGTVNWELRTIKANGLDAKHGFTLEVIPFANNEATKIALLGREVDMIVSDWLYVSRVRAEGKDLTFVPYSTAVGAVMVRSDGTIATLADLGGKTIGVAGGPLDKNWLTLQGYARQAYGFDLAGSTRVEFGAPPLLAKKFEQGELDAVLNYWHFCAKLEAKGFKRLIDANAAAAALGATGPISAIGYVFYEGWADANEAAAKGFVAASREAKALLAASDAAWDDLRDLIKPRSEAEFETLKSRFRKGIPARSLAEEVADTARVYDLLATLGGRKLVGSARRLSDGTYWKRLMNGS